MKLFPVLLTLIFCSVGSICKGQKANNGITNKPILAGQMPSIVTDQAQLLHLVYGSGDSILYSFSVDHGGVFSVPRLIAVLPKLVCFAMRGPQIAAINGGIIVLACDKTGNMYCYRKMDAGQWTKTGRVNDQDNVSKEGFMALSGWGNSAFAVWLDLRDNHNKIYGARSIDGGITWSDNMRIYSSPDSTVCECCKPSVALRGDSVYIMFRNWLGGNRDMYLIRSADGGRHFGQAEKLGNGRWPLNGCPMDGGGLAIGNNGALQTIWRRNETLYACEPGHQERVIATGRQGAVSKLGGKNIYAWAEQGMIYCLLPDGKKRALGKGEIPLISSFSSREVVYIWENDKKIMRSIIQF